MYERRTPLFDRPIDYSTKPKLISRRIFLTPKSRQNFFRNSVLSPCVYTSNAISNRTPRNPSTFRECPRISYEYPNNTTAFINITFDTPPESSISHVLLLPIVVIVKSNNARATGLSCPQIVDFHQRIIIYIYIYIYRHSLGWPLFDFYDKQLCRKTTLPHRC